MRIGIYGGNVRRGKPLASLVDEVVEKEEQGFSSYWTPQVGTFDALTLLALAGQQTSRIELGTAVVPSYPRHPSALAQQAATVNALCGGRLILGVGPSHAPGIEALGLAYDRPALHMREYVTVLNSRPWAVKAALISKATCTGCERASPALTLHRSRSSSPPSRR